MVSFQVCFETPAAVKKNEKEKSEFSEKTFRVFEI